MEVLIFHSDILKHISKSSRQSQTRIRGYIELLKKYGHELRMPFSKQVDRNLFELRLKGENETRIMYCFYDNKAFLLHIFAKKSKKTPIKDLETAQQRRKHLTGT